MAKPKNPGLPDRLWTPLPRRRRLGLLAQVQDDPEWTREFRVRFLLLLQHYGLSGKEDDLWERLCYYLMRDFIPGYSEAEPEKRGRPRTLLSPKNKALRKQFLQEVRAYKERNPSHSDTAAFKALRRRWSKHEPAHPFARKADRTLRKYLSLAKREEMQESDSFRLFMNLTTRHRRSLLIADDGDTSPRTLMDFVDPESQTSGDDQAEK